MTWAVRAGAGVCGLLRLSLVVLMRRAGVRRSADLLQWSALPPNVCVTVCLRERVRKVTLFKVRELVYTQQQTFTTNRKMQRREKCVVHVSVILNIKC